MPPTIPHCSRIQGFAGFNCEDTDTNVGTRRELNTEKPQLLQLKN